jgi:hypothetical protein
VVKSKAEDYPRFMAVMAATFDRLSAGKRTYGAFSPATDRRDLRHEAEEELLDAIMYTYLAILKLDLTRRSTARKGLGRRPDEPPGTPLRPSRFHRQTAYSVNNRMRPSVPVEPVGLERVAKVLGSCS